MPPLDPLSPPALGKVTGLCESDLASFCSDAADSAPRIGEEPAEDAVAGRGCRGVGAGASAEEASGRAHDEGVEGAEAEDAEGAAEKEEAGAEGAVPTRSFDSRSAAAAAAAAAAAGAEAEAEAGSSALPPPPPPPSALPLALCVAAAA